MNQTGQDADLFRRLQGLAPSKFRFREASELTAARLPGATGPDPHAAIRVNIGARSANPVLEVLAGGGIEARSLPQEQAPGALGEVRIFTNLMPGEVWIEAVVPLSALESLLLLDTVLGIEPAGASQAQ